MPDLNSLSIDQQVALRGAATTLQDEFAGTFSPETVEQVLQASFDQFAERSRLANFLPLMAERFAVSACERWPESRAGETRAHRSCCSSVCTMPADRRWRSAGSTISPATGHRMVRRF
jgi:hypothetical protein